MKRKNVITIHLLFWFYMINQMLFPLYVGKIEGGTVKSGVFLLESLVTLILNIISFYLIYFTFTRMLQSRKWILAALTGLVLIPAIVAFRVPADYYLCKIFGILENKEFTFYWAWAWNDLRLVIIFGIYSILIRVVINWFESQKLKDELINRQQAGELALLRSQINPHFLFNTLNNIYSLVYRKSDEAPEAVMKLSSIMRYMLYDATTDKVPLEKEVEYLKSFIELQNLRIKHPGFVSLQTEGETESRFIAPMLLISFVENAFKHGSKSHSPGIIIRLTVLEEKTTFEVVNYLKKMTVPNNGQDSGKGLKNIRRRLELIYPGKHKLEISQETETFRIYLEIET